MLTWSEFNQQRMAVGNEYRNKNRLTRKQIYKRYTMTHVIVPSYTEEEAPMYNELVHNYNARLATTGCLTQCITPDEMSKIYPQEKGNNPMSYIDDLSYAVKTAQKSPKTTSDAGAVASVTLNAPPSDESVQRSFLLKELEEMTRYEWNQPKVAKLRKLFNVDAPKYPASSQELIDAFKNGTIEIDEKKVALNAKFMADSEDFDDDRYDSDDEYIGERFYGIKFTNLPVSDRKGFDAAMAEYRKLIVDTKRKIVVGTPAAGLDALMAFEAWMPAAPVTEKKAK